MKIFGTVDSFVETGGQDLKLGRPVATLEFLKALLRYGTFDAYHLFCPSVANLRLTQQVLEAEFEDQQTRRKIMLSSHLLTHQHLATVDYSAFHVGGWGKFVPRLAFLRARTSQQGFPISGVIHSLHSADIFPKMRELVAAPLADCDAIVCTSRAGQQVFENYLADTVARVRAETGVEPKPTFGTALIPLGVSERYFRGPTRAAARQALGLSQDSVVLLYLGRVSAHTKADLVPLLYAFRAVLARPGKTRDVVLVIGGGADLPNLQALSAAAAELGLTASVRLEPNVTDEQKLTLYAAAEVFVSPVDNHQETFGLSLLEAMAAGLPVVASDFDGYRELVVDGSTGMLMPTIGTRAPDLFEDLLGILDPSLSQFVMAQTVAVDVEALADRLGALVDSRELRERLGSAGRERAQRDFSWKSVIARYEALWAELKARARTPAAAPRDPYTGDLFRVFAHYPTRQLADGDRFELSALGAEVLAGTVPAPALYEDIAPLVDRDLGPLLVSLLAKGPASVDACAQAASTALNIPAQWVRFQLGWLLKNGLIRRAPASPPASPP